jgi:DNA-binding NarL/FixJ family response regulator
MSGCDGFISKAVSSGTLLDAVLNVAAGASVVSRDALDHRVADPAEFTALSASEADVLRLIARGRTPADISAVLDLSPSETTLRTDAVVEKLRASTPLEAVVVASRNGLLDLWSD